MLCIQPCISLELKIFWMGSEGMFIQYITYSNVYSYSCIKFQFDRLSIITILWSISKLVLQYTYLWCQLYFKYIMNMMWVSGNGNIAVSPCHFSSKFDALVYLQNNRMAVLVILYNHSLQFVPQLYTLKRFLSLMCIF